MLQMRPVIPEVRNLWFSHLVYLSRSFYLLYRFCNNRDFIQRPLDFTGLPGGLARALKCPRAERLPNAHILRLPLFDG